MPAKITNEIFTQRFYVNFEPKYIIIKDSFIKMSSKVGINCPDHGDNWVIASSLFRKDISLPCPICSRQKLSKNMQHTCEEFVQKAKSFSNSSHIDYSKVEYKNTNTPVVLICKEHGEFKCTPRAHLRLLRDGGTPCKKCRGKSQLKSHDQVIESFRKIHGNMYDYSKVDYKGATKKVIITCPKHGEFHQVVRNHYSGAGCPVCCESKGEKIVRQSLEESNISFIKEYKFDDCRGYKRPLPFDFYLPELHICIEYDGIQHFAGGDHHFGKKGGFEATQKNDDIKTNFCNDNGIQLIRVDYTMTRETIINTITELHNQKEYKYE